jgi:hypothetical protein
MGVQVYWVLFLIMDNQEFQHGSSGVLGFIFYNGLPKNAHGELDYIFYNGQSRNPTWGVQVYWVLFFI